MRRISLGYTVCYIGKEYGTAVSFTKTAQLSAQYCPVGPNEMRKVFYCEVLLGLTVVGDHSMLEPPLINPEASSIDRYDSTVDNVANPSVYVSCYRDNMAYPTYLITFK